MPPAELAISLQGVSKSYRIAKDGLTHHTLAETLLNAIFGRNRNSEHGIFKALDNVTLDILRGEVIGLIGRNGAGKSTLLKVLSQITGPTAGQICLYGRVGSLLELGAGFHPELTGAENIYLNGAVLGMRRHEIRRHFDAIVDFAGVETFLNTPVKRYSSGMYMRLAFAVAAHLDAEILLVDEVLSVGDAEFQRRCLGKMHDAAQSGRTVLFVSHNMGVVTSLCDKAVWLETGRVREIGPAAKLIPAYLAASDTQTSRLLDLTERKREQGFGERLRLETMEWVTGLPLLHGEDACMRVTFTARAKLEGVAIGMGFCNPDGARLLSYDTDLEHGDRRSFLPGERMTVSLTIPRLPLAPGHYALDIGARSGDRFGLDYLPCCMPLQVVPGPNTPGSIIRPGAGVRLHGIWAWEPCAAPCEGLDLGQGGG